MTRLGPRAFAGLALALFLATSGCAGRGERVREVSDLGAPTSGLYRVTVVDPEEGRRRFRMLLFADLPDRLHGEILSPVGSVVLLFDGGRGRLAVTFVRDRVSFAGPAGEQALERVLGVGLTLEELVRALLTGEGAAGAPEVIREAEASTGLPRRLVIDDGVRNVTLELKRLQPLRGPATRLGSGEPPQGMEVRPLSELTLYPPSADLLELEPGADAP